MRPSRLSAGIALVVLMVGTSAVLLSQAEKRSSSANPCPPGETYKKPIPPASCPVTRPPDPPFVPTQPYLAKPSAGSFWYGSERLWVSLGEDGVWGWQRHRPGHENDLTAKIPWWRKDYDWRKEAASPLKVSGRRLDGKAPPLQASCASGSYASDWKSFMMMGVYVPAPGCWEITGDYRGDKLSFVIWVGK